MPQTVLIELPKCVKYCWWMAENGQTMLEKTANFFVPCGKRIKVVTYTANNNMFVCSGNAIFKVQPSQTPTTIMLRWPRHVTQEVSKAEFVSNTMEAVVHGQAQDLSLVYQQQLQKAMHGHGRLQGMNKFWKIDWEWPFMTPGWIGLREISADIPGWVAAIPWLQFHALSVMGKESPEACSTGEWLSVVSMAVGAAGYLDGYDHEDVDDTTYTWSSWRTGNDCDDFAVAAASLVDSILSHNIRPTCKLHSWLKRHVTEVYVVSGIAWPKNEMENGKRKTCGHMWVELALNIEPKILVVECTAAVAYYGGTPLARNSRKGFAHGKDSEYLTREFHWFSDKAYRVEGEKRTLLQLPTLPSWLYSLRFSPPEERLDGSYQKPSAPPAPIRASGFYNSRRHKGNGTVSARIFPFGLGKIVWTNEDTQAEHFNGAFS